MRLIELKCTKLEKQSSDNTVVGKNSKSEKSVTVDTVPLTSLRESYH